MLSVEVQEKKNIYIYIYSIGKCTVISVHAANPGFFPMALSDFFLYAKINGAPDLGRNWLNSQRETNALFFKKHI